LCAELLGPPVEAGRGADAIAALLEGDATSVGKLGIHALRDGAAQALRASSGWPAVTAPPFPFPAARHWRAYRASQGANAK
jgi:hypothetical protein